ncbi:hypothetical protein [Kitasatospora herbaricolor]
MGRLPPDQSAKTIENATAFGFFSFTDAIGQALRVRSRSDPGYRG